MGCASSVAARRFTMSLKDSLDARACTQHSTLCVKLWLRTHDMLPAAGKRGLVSLNDALPTQARALACTITAPHQQSPTCCLLVVAYALGVQGHAVIMGRAGGRQTKYGMRTSSDSMESTLTDRRAHLSTVLNQGAYAAVGL